MDLNLNWEDKQKKANKKTSILFALSTWMLLVSFLQTRNHQFVIHVSVDMLVAFLCGILHTVIEILYFRQAVKYCYSKEDENKKNINIILRGFVLLFAYTAVYNTILLPFSGFGLIECILVFVVLIYYLVSYTTTREININGFFDNLNIFISSKNSIIVLHVLLFVIKLITFVSVENLYSNIITGNDTIRSFIAIATFCILVMFLISGLVAIKGKLKIPASVENSIKNNTKNVGNKIVGNVAKVAKNGAGIVASGIKSLALKPIWSAVIILIVGVILIGLFIFAIFKIREDMLNFIEPFFLNIFSTGKYTTEINGPYILFKIGFVIIYSVFILYNNINTEDDYVNYVVYYENLDEKNKEQIALSLQDLYKNNRNLRNDILHNIDFYKKIIETSIDQNKTE